VDSSETPALLALFEEAWRRAGRPGVGPCQLMDEDWSDQSESKADFYRLETVAREGEGAHYFTITPVVADMDDDGRPVVTGVVHTLKRTSHGFDIVYSPVKASEAGGPS
jgi:hypothetical protein